MVFIRLVILFNILLLGCYVVCFWGDVIFELVFSFIGLGFLVGIKLVFLFIVIWWIDLVFFLRVCCEINV